MTGKNNFLMENLNNTLALATGCTEPVAVAYSSAVARAQLSGELELLEITVDPGIYKNGIYVGIPGIKERGIEVAAALGVVIGNPEKKLRIFEDISEESLKKALNIIANDRIKVNIKENCNRLYIETKLHTKGGKVRVITLDNHTNIYSIEKSDSFEPFVCPQNIQRHCGKDIQRYSLPDIIKFVETISLEDFSTIQRGIDVNLQIAQEGLYNEQGLGTRIMKMVNEGKLSDDIISRAQILCAAASEARMSGIRLPVMSVTGSGNHGITVFLTNIAVAEKGGIENEKLYRALALSSLLTAYIKSYTGILSAMCGCGVAAGIGASAGVAYQLGGSIEAIFGAMLNMVGSITGIICDGGKEGCAYKLALASGWAVQSALLSLNNAIVNRADGILVPEFKKLFENMGYICDPGMIATNSSILKVIVNK